MDNGYIDKMKESIFKIADPNNGYSLDDFNNEFGNVTPIRDYKIELKFENKSTNPNPEYATGGSSGMDLRASLSEDVSIPVGGRVIIPTDLFFEIPENFEIQVRSRSGMAAKNGVVVLNSPATIDADYRGNLKIILINHGNIPFIVKHGDRIAQAVIASVVGKNIIKLVQVEKISDNTERSTNGFGSTGIN